jgi:hypothetical protein
MPLTPYRNIHHPVHAVLGLVLTYNYQIGIKLARIRVIRPPLNAALAANHLCFIFNALAALPAQNYSLVSEHHDNPARMNTVKSAEKVVNRTDINAL